MAALSNRSTIIFDFDGTIADTKSGIIGTATRVLTEWGMSEAQLTHVSDIIGPPFPHAFVKVFGVSLEDAEEITRRYRAIYKNLGVQGWPAFPGMRELLVELHDAGKRLAVASSKQAWLVERGLADNDLLALFDPVEGKKTDDDRDKVDAIRAAMACCGATTEDAVMVGDRHHDVEAAHLVGIPCIGVLYGETAEEAELVDAGAAAIAHTMDELRTLLLG
jgi:phosphoglycolate phosphatase